MRFKYFILSLACLASFSAFGQSRVALKEVPVIKANLVTAPFINDYVYSASIEDVYYHRREACWYVVDDAIYCDYKSLAYNVYHFNFSVLTNHDLFPLPLPSFSKYESPDSFLPASMISSDNPTYNHFKPASEE